MPLTHTEVGSGLFKTLSGQELKVAKHEAKKRAQARRVAARFGSGSQRADRPVSTFTQRFDGLREQLVERAKATPALLETVFTLHGAPTDTDIMQSIENRLFTLIHEYPFWFAQTPDADNKAHVLTRDHAISNGLIKAAPLTPNQQAAFDRRRQERLEREQRISARVHVVNHQPTDN